MQIPPPPWGMGWGRGSIVIEKSKGLLVIPGTMSDWIKTVVAMVTSSPFDFQVEDCSLGSLSDFNKNCILSKLG